MVLVIKENELKKGTGILKKYNQSFQVIGRIKKSKDKSGYCFIGKHKGIRSCMKVDENDVAIQNINNVLKIKRPTDFWFPKESTHKEVLESVEKYIPDFTQDRIAISRNLYHNESIDFYFLPTLMTASKIYDTNVMDYLERKEEQQIFNFMVDYVNKEIEKNKIERILVPDETMYNYMQNKKTKPFEHEVIFNIDKKIVKSN